MNSPTKILTDAKFPEAPAPKFAIGQEVHDEKAATDRPMWVLGLRYEYGWSEDDEHWPGELLPGRWEYLLGRVIASPATGAPPTVAVGLGR